MYTTVSFIQPLKILMIYLKQHSYLYRLYAPYLPVHQRQSGGGLNLGNSYRHIVLVRAQLDGE
jgi:hypothetical protein